MVGSSKKRDCLIW